MEERNRKWKLYQEAREWISPIPFESKNPQCYTVEDFMDHFKIEKEEANKLINKLIEEKKLERTPADNVFISIRVCDICGKKYDDWDLQENNYYVHHFGYGSKHDLQRIEYDVCADCFDKMVDLVLPLFPKSPLKDEDTYQDDPGRELYIQEKYKHDNDPF